jgi:hypothetical protein
MSGSSHRTVSRPAAEAAGADPSTSAPSAEGASGANQPPGSAALVINNPSPNTEVNPPGALIVTNPHPHTPTHQTAAGEAPAPSAPLAPVTSPGDVNNEQDELQRAIESEQEAYRAGEKARQESLVLQAQRSGGDVNHEASILAAERATEKARHKAARGRPAGVYVTSPIKVQGDVGPVFAPVGMRLTDNMVARILQNDPQAIKKMEAQELVEDLR